MQREDLKYKTLPIAFIDEPVKVPIALYVDETEPATAAIDILSILKNNKAKAIRFSTLAAICKALDCQPGDILQYVPEEENDEAND